MRWVLLPLRIVSGSSWVLMERGCHIQIIYGKVWPLVQEWFCCCCRPFLMVSLFVLVCWEIPLFDCSPCFLVSCNLGKFSGLLMHTSVFHKWEFWNAIKSFWNSQAPSVARKPRTGTFPKVQRKQFIRCSNRVCWNDLPASPESKCFETHLPRHTPQFKAFLLHEASSSLSLTEYADEDDVGWWLAVGGLLDGWAAIGSKDYGKEFSHLQGQWLWGGSFQARPKCLGSDGWSVHAERCWTDCCIWCDNWLQNWYISLQWFN